MSRRAKGPRLWFNGKRGLYVILDSGGIQRGTGCDAGDREGAERALQDYIQAKHTARLTTRNTRDPAHIPIADVLNLYLKDIAPSRARPAEIVDRLLRITEFFGAHNLDYVTGATCRAYAASRSTPQAARRELEDLRAAINHHRREGLHDRLVSVTLPARAQSRERWLTRKEAAALIRAAWRYRERQNLRATDRATRKHVARFMVVARFMGSRAAVICGASLEDRRPAGRSWVDLTNGTFYGRAVGERETNKRKQTVRIPPALLAHMRRWRARGQRYVVEWNGSPVRRITKAHKAVCRSLGMEDVTPHVWRHSAATWGMQNGGDVWEIAGFLGMTPQILERVYGHHAPDHFENAHRAISRPSKTVKDNSEHQSNSRNRSAS